jgi:hypothetical protein
VGYWSNRSPPGGFEETNGSFVGIFADVSTLEVGGRTNSFIYVLGMAL